MQEAKKNPVLVLLAGSAISLAVQAELRARAEGLEVRVATPADDDYAVLKEYCDADVNSEYLRVQHLQEDMKMARIEPYAGASELFGTRQQRARAKTRKKTDRRFKL